MSEPTWYASKKGYTTVLGDDRVTVFWVGDKNAPWRFVARGIFSDGFQSLSDAFDAVAEKTGIKASRFGCVDIDPAQREAHARHAAEVEERERKSKQSRQSERAGGADRRESPLDRLRRMQQSADDAVQQAMAGMGNNSTHTTRTDQQNPFGSGAAADGKFQSFMERMYRASSTGQGTTDDINAFKQAAERRRQEQAKAKADAEAKAKAKQQGQQRGGQWHWGDSFGSAFDRMHQAEGGRRTEEHAAPPRPQQTKRSWWVVLGVTAQCSGDEAKAAFRKLAMLHHPDRGGSTEKMAELNTAWEQACTYLNIK